MKKSIILLLLFLSGCYKCYTPENEDIENIVRVDDYIIIEVDSTVAEADALSETVEVDIDTGIVDIGDAIVNEDAISTVDGDSKEDKAVDKTAKEEDIQEPILYDVVPNQGCKNKDTEIYLVGMYIHWEASIKIKYRDGEFTTFDKNLVDECNRSLIDWYDTAMISFRTRDDLILGDEHGFLSGNYRVVVINPNGKESNEIGLSLQSCNKEVEEIEGCYGN